MLLIVQPVVERDRTIATVVVLVAFALAHTQLVGNVTGKDILDVPAVKVPHWRNNVNFQ